ncbi:MAG: hypothetical protein FWD49_04285 [Firmicutes bacterium]|nr:hypothetical protein [Bacillota bacterium]
MVKHILVVQPPSAQRTMHSVQWWNLFFSAQRIMRELFIKYEPRIN